MRIGHTPMRRLFDFKTLLRTLSRIGTWTLLVAPVAALSGSASAFFLAALEHVTRLRFAHPWVLFCLPATGALIVWVYSRWGKGSEAGNSLVVEEIHQPGGGVPARMAPLVLWATLMTHLAGGSAGREGTAVQMGGSIAAAWSRLFKFGRANQRVLLLAGVAAGFGSVFGTPLTGAVFAMEVLAIGRIEYDALIPVLVASIIGDQICAAWGCKHTLYHIAVLAPATGVLSRMGAIAEAAAAGIVFGLASRLFIGLDHGVKALGKRLISVPPMRAVAGGCVVLALTYAFGLGDYLGLGILPEHPGSVTIVSAFSAGGATSSSWLWKLVLTAITLGSGFKGGEVTPLFFIGATLGNALAVLSGGQVDLFAGMGFIAVFAAAANTPLACTIMGIELFGSAHALEFAAACFVAYTVSGHASIYGTQKVAVPKTPLPHLGGLSSLEAADRADQETSR